MAFSWRRHESVEEFLAAAGAFLEGREAENNLIFGIASAIRITPELFGEDPPSFATVSDDTGRIVAATLRTPPHNQVLSWIEDLNAVDTIVDALREEPLPGLLGPTEAALRFATAWTDATGQSARVEVAERIFRLQRVIPPARPADGGWRIAEAHDRDLIARWVVAFSSEAVPEAPPIPDPVAVANRWVAQVGHLGYVWEDAGEVVSLVGAGGETPNGIRIGPVYTPPEWRNHGYASSLTVAASADQLERGRRFVFLFTDLANPTSNKIYQAIGYEPVCDMDMYRFGRLPWVQTVGRSRRSHHRSERLGPRRSHGGATAEPPRNHRATTAQPPRSHGGATAEPPRNHRGTTAEPPERTSYWHPRLTAIAARPPPARPIGDGVA